MATKAEFLLAAEELTSAAEHVGELMVAAENTDAARILRGGALGHHVPLQIEASARTAHACRVMIENAIETCRRRAEVIEMYELELARYDLEYGDYEARFHDWSYLHGAWLMDDTGLVARAGPPPVPPSPPAAPPSWADVRRPRTLPS